MNEIPDDNDEAIGLIALAEPPQSHSLTKDVQRLEASQDIPISALAYANLAVFSALLFCLSGLSASVAITYVLSVFAWLCLMAISAKILRRDPNRIPGFWNAVGFGIVSELALGSILVFDYFAMEHAPLFPAIAITASISFVSVPLIAHFIKPFLITKTTLIFLSCCYVLISPEQTNKTIAIAALFIALLLMVSIGYWLIRRRRDNIRLRLQLIDLNTLTETQNKKISESFAEIQKAKIRSENDFALRQRLLSYIGHDLRQPVNAANYILLELSNRNRNSELNNLIADAQECIQSTSNMISDVVQITHYDNTKIDIQLEDFQLDPVISQIIRESSSSAELVGSRIRYVSTSIQVVSDPELLARILRNLLRNAIKHAFAKDILVGVRRSSKHVYLCVIDNGKGMIDSPADTRGLGLGLKISEQLAASCGGQLIVHSEIGCGTMCRVKIPRSTNRDSIK